MYYWSDDVEFSVGRPDRYMKVMSVRHVIRVLIAVMLLGAASIGWAQADPPPPPPPPPPSDSSAVGETVTNPLTGFTTTVSFLRKDPTGTTTEGDTAWVDTADGYSFLVKDLNEIVYNEDDPPVAFQIVALDTATNLATLDALPLGCVTPETATEPCVAADDLAINLETTELDEKFVGTDTPGDITDPVIVTGADGVRRVSTGQNGSNGRAGALFVPPRSGGNGATGPGVSYTNTIDINTSSRYGIEAGSIGGKGGKGGSSYLSFWSGRDGGDGGGGGTVAVTNAEGVQVATDGTEHHGIFAYSKSGAAGNGGSGFAAPGGGVGGHSSDGGSTTVTNNGTVITQGDASYGIYGLSVSGNGGSGGDSWGLVGKAGSGGAGGDGGSVNLTNNGTIITEGVGSHGIVGHSIGGSGGSAGDSNQLIFAINGGADNGGDGGTVTVTNNGFIRTEGNQSRAMFAQSIGGGGGSGSNSWGLVALGGSGANGGNSGTVTMTNAGTIETEGTFSDGMFGQSVGGSGGGGGSATGLVAVGGSGENAGDGGVVTLENSGSISTLSDFARGMVAQSIGGGGGDGGSGTAMVAVGGSGGGGGDSDVVTVFNSGSISTMGRDASAIFAQSVGGGGGNGGSANSVSAFVGVAVGGDGGKGGEGGAVNVNLQGGDGGAASVITTAGDRSTGIFAQSIGGGGGNGGGAVQITGGYIGAVSIAVGGQGGSAGAGGDVTVTPGSGGLSIVETGGADSAGVYLQSVGGGGGNGGYAISVAVAGGDTVGGALSVGIGGNGGGGGAGGDVQIGQLDDATGELESVGIAGSILTRGDRSTGLFAQSVGGGGGNGGLAVSGAASAAGAFSASVGIGVGGKGAKGGAGGLVEAGYEGDITTEGDHSTGMLVQSVGGGGGNGGGSVAASLSASGGGAVSASVGVGGAAGEGSIGGAVRVATRSGTVLTGGESSTGIVVQSIGGGGGNGGYSVAVGVAGAGTGAGSINVGVGGSGAGGGAGGLVLADLQSDVATFGDNSSAILVQSVGGGGGNGGFSVAGGIAAAGTGAGTVSVGLGGKGGGGNTGGDVTASSIGEINTSGANSGGLIVQSIGGGGGNGGFSVTGSLAGAGTGAGAVSVGLAGSGNSGGIGGAVDATSGGNVTTRGNMSTGILAQSVGGGGGNGGFTVNVTMAGGGTGAGAIGVGLGGAGGSGADGGTVDLSVDNNVITLGSDSAGVIAQSVGGGGGNGGFNVTVAGAGAGTGAGAVGVGLGGSGAGGGDGKRVTSTMTGDIGTEGANSAGLVVQSVGGGGGNGGFNVTASISGAGTGSGGASVGLGGSAGSGGDSGEVESTLTGDVITLGDDSTAVVAQSLGGGGGNGGVNVSGTITVAGTGSGGAAVGIGGAGGDGGDVVGTVTNTVTGNVTTAGDGSGGVLAQSLGGGGGNGGLNVSGAITAGGSGTGAAAVGVGGSGGGGGDSQAVTNTVTGNVVTLGSNATGIVAQSLGGGGGNGGINVSGAIGLSKTGAGAAAVGIGGSGGDGGDALGAVKNTVTGNVSTAGNDSGGVLAQSLGGGGGNGGLNVSGTITAAGTGAGAVAVGVGGSGGDGGNAFSVENTVTGDVTTIGTNAAGVVAQSLGGGGGNGGTNISGSIALSKSAGVSATVGIGGSGGLGGEGRAVTNTVTGDVSTSGDDAYGVLAQSIGGGGGNGGINVSGAVAISNSTAVAVAVGVGGAGGGGGISGTVDNTVTGLITTDGVRSGGVVTQSLGGGGGNGGVNVSATLTAAKSTAGGLSVGVGGLGGDGKDGANATSTVTGGVITLGDDSPGVLTQSLGGGGGNGGVNVTAAVNLTKGKGGAIGVGVGGFGGGGGNAGDVVSTVTVTDSNLIGTVGDQSHAVMAQSIGGGGGNGGVNVTGVLSASAESGASVGVGVGGFGGGAGDGGSVTLDATGDVVTEGNDSHGLFAQSLGGGGGNGGVNVSAALNINKKSTGGAASIGVGGFGGEGGDSGAVKVTYRGDILAAPSDAEGAGSHGLVAQSLAGGGGNGAVNVSAGLAFSSTGDEGDGHALVVGIGGFGGLGGDAGLVDVTVSENSSIVSSGDDRSAILAQSIGGGGGNGGLNVSGGVAADAPIVFGMGGFGAGGGQANTVTVDATADLMATGKNARGIFAQSVGGGGGDGGLNISGAVSYSKSTTPPALVFGMGGFGGAGNISSDVDVTHAGTVLTSGADGHGIFAQSIAGGGGNGGLNVSTALILSDDDDSGGFKDISLTAGMGGHGGTGADAGDTSVNSIGNITTEGDAARGIFAQSIGGGGGNGGMNFTGNIAQKSSLATVGIGGFGAGGGNAGDASVFRGNADTVAGKITTNGIGAIGIESTSIGGGGGDAGLNLVAAVSLAGDGDDSGDGGDDGDNGDERPHPKHTGVDPEVFTNYDKVLDELEGREKKDKKDEEQKKDESGFAVQVAIGGSGGGAGDGGNAIVSNFGDVETQGKQSHGILAQSIGGGGGNAAANIAITYLRGDSLNRGLNFALGGAGGDGGSGSTVLVDHDGIVETQGADSYGIIAQSVGGGGGNASAFINKQKGDMSKLDISIGRLGGTGGEGGDVTLNSNGTVVTRGNRSWGLIAQSIGNGGGNSSATTISGTVAGEKGTADRGASLSIGLEGGVGGSAGDVDLTAQGFVVTEGNAAHAIFAQSVGGGGGNGGDAGATSANASISLGGSGGEGGTGGAVDVINAAEVRTLGASSYGLIAQSIGGGGGTGGKSEAEVESSEPGLTVSLGGSGGTGSTGGDVTVANAGVIITGGDESIGMFAQSIGGGGGNGGMSVTSLKTKEKEESDDDNSNNMAGGSGSGDDDSGTMQLAVNIGGNAGEGAAAGSVRVTNTGGVGTAGASAVGIFAQSIGGGGGNASQVVSKYSGAGAKLNTGIGGSGGVGGTGGDVTVENLADEGGNAAQIITQGSDAHGIVAMSIGGGGGNGSTVVSENEDAAKSEQKQALGVSINIGGSAGTGGSSGLVTVTNAGQILTEGEGAHGIFAQSIGGGGGNGGVTYARTGAGNDSGVDSAISIGGAGGSGDVSGDVNVFNSGSIEVFGDSAYGVFAQSIGGGGGNGGMSGAKPIEGDANSSNLEPEPLAPSLLSFALGGEAGAGADSGDVLVDHQGSIISHGDNSYGIFAQSVAGGGGTAGATYSSPVGKAAEFVLPLLLGSRDGGSGESGTVTINTEGDITMLGANSQPFLAQAVNGGGGNVRLTLDTSKTTLGQVNPGPDKPEDPVSAFIVALVEVGSDAVENGLGSAIKSEHVGTLVSLGKSSPASSTQSVGGGGGNADVDLTVNSGAVVELEFLLGGSNSVNSGGGDIGFRQDGNAVTAGDASKAVSVQSIGGGGGNVTVSLTTIDDAQSEPPQANQRLSADGVANRQKATALASLAAPATAAQATAAASSKQATITLGSNGSFGNDGGDISAAFNGDTRTEGQRSPGLVIQSIGAGGGDVRVSGTDNLDINVGGRGGASGDGGNIELVNSGNVETLGLLSHGIVLQSIGGGGGMVLTDMPADRTELTLSADNVGSGGESRFTQQGNVVVGGEGSIALVAQSLGGGGGLVDRLFLGSAGGDGDSGAITVDVFGNLVANGEQGVGAFLQSAAKDDQGDLTLTINQNFVVQGGADGVGVWFSGGDDNVFNNSGSVGTADGIMGMAILAEDGSNDVENFGFVTGRVDLGGGTNLFRNHEGGVFSAGPTLQLGGPDSLLLNEGSIVLWDESSAESVLVSGSFTQASSGETFAELDFAADRIDNLVSTGTVDLAGTVDVALLNVAVIPIGDFSRNLFFGGFGVTDSGIELLTSPSVVIDYDLGFEPQAAVLKYTVDFVPDGMGSNLNAVGDYINRGQQAGGGNSAYGRLVEFLVYEPDLDGYRQALSQLSPEFYAEQQSHLIDSGTEFGSRLMSCKQTGGEHRFTREGSCFWLLVEDESRSLDRHDDYKAIDTTMQRVAIGVQKTLDNDWSFGAGFARDRSVSRGYDGNWHGTTLTHQFGVSAKRRFGASKFSAVFNYASSETDSTRTGSLMDEFWTDVSRDMGLLSLAVRAQHDFEFDTWYLRPRLDLGVTQLKADRATETGLGAASLVLNKFDETHSWVRPAVEAGTEIQLESESRIRFNLDFGAQQYLSGNTTSVRASFAGAPESADPMRLGSDLGDPRFGSSVGVDYLMPDNAVFQLYYQRNWSDNRNTDTVRFKFAFPF